MSYEKQTWASGDVITAEKLSHIEDGIEGCGDIQLVVTVSQDEQYHYVLDKSSEEIYNAIERGMQIKINSELNTISSFIATVENASILEDERYYIVLSHLAKLTDSDSPRYKNVTIFGDGVTDSVTISTPPFEAVKVVAINPGAPGSDKYVSGVHKTALQNTTYGTVLGVETGGYNRAKVYLFDGNSFYRFTYTPQANKLTGTFFTFSEQSQTELTKTEKTISFDVSE